MHSCYRTKKKEIKLRQALDYQSNSATHVAERYVLQIFES